MWSCYSPRRHCLSPNPVDNSKSTIFSVSGSCLLYLPSLHPEHVGLPDAPTFLPISLQSPELQALKNSRVICFGSPVWKQETQRHVVNLSNAHQLVQSRARSQALSSVKVPSIFSLFCCVLSPSLDLVSMEHQKWWQKFYRQPALP